MGDRHHKPLPTTPIEERVVALEALLTGKGILTSEEVDRVIEYYEHEVGPMNGARVVARAWCDPAYRERLLEDATSAIAELGFSGPEGDHMVVVENTPACTTWWCAPCARATRGPCSVSLPTGTRVLPIDPEWCASRGSRSRRWAVA